MAKAIHKFIGRVLIGSTRHDVHITRSGLAGVRESHIELFKSSQFNADAAREDLSSGDARALARLLLEAADAADAADKDQAEESPVASS